jgi:hypothetical protein
MSSSENPALILSYVPLYYGEHALAVGQKRARVIKEIERVLAEAQGKGLGAAAAMLWSQDGPDSVGNPIFVLDYGAEIAKHIMWWSENHPEKFFEFCLRQESEAYAATLMPNSSQSTARLEFAAGKKINPKGVLCIPIRFMSRRLTTIEQLAGRLPKIGDRIRVGILDKALIDTDNPDPISAFQPDDIFWLNDIPVGTSDSYLSGLIHPAG